MLAKSSSCASTRWRARLKGCATSACRSFPSDSAKEVAAFVLILCGERRAILH